MIKSMTAFARETRNGVLGDLTWELRTVNHRFLEPHIRLPEELRALEVPVRARLTASLQRGKLDCTLRYSPAVGVVGALRVNKPFVEQLLAAGREVDDLIGRPCAPSSFELLRWPGVLQEQEPDLDRLTAEALELLDAAIASLVATRAREGERLDRLLRDRCARLQEAVVRVRARMPEVLDAVRARLRERLDELKAELDPQRLEQEIALVAAKLDVDEEMDRLEAHVAEVLEVLARDEPVGRRLDFLMQELNREANTLGSKSSDVAVTREAVEMKVLIEQMREQVQNLE
ncbi:YicC family protein [Thiorhodococcus mannitoliphagus]|uniref:YicC family protein n=1 Tax=Thiorhodococcus mannitoliphagus TaxID=329406 RepID=A0A6P1DQ98_9GAMM|nr:YicC/YloC family endoribonuclease [Thiorhodococcus mannitoliphagus]NEX18836.1 YicC family protein [Thiorhodococcus mannitoliphagus]